MPSFHVVPGPVVSDILRSSPAAVVALVRRTYLLHSRGRAINPRSYFLRFPERPENRIIALPAHLDDDRPVSGLKWISSYPSNVENNLPRASAVLILNDAANGYPMACLEASLISAARTAASAVLAAQALAVTTVPKSVAFIGAGIIGRTVLDYLVTSPLPLAECSIYDLVSEYADAFVDYARDRHGWHARRAGTAAAAAADADLVVFATTAARPYLTDGETFRAGQIVLHLSLRDIGPELMAECSNVVDDIDHCLTAQTSAHLAEQQFQTRDFIDGTLADVLRGDLVPDGSRPVVFSPFGLGVLDLALGYHVYEAAVRDGRAVAVEDFFVNLARW